MNLHEIEETLRTLESRHSDLDEQMLATLLRGGGWEEKNIQEALFLFRSEGKGKTQPEMTGSFPPIQEDPVFIPRVDENHMLLEHNEETAPDPQSLVTPTPQPIQPGGDELPHNLPLRPFETSEHIWPFSRYRDVFYGEVQSKPEPAKEEVKADSAGPPAEAKIEEEGAVGKSEPPAVVTEVEIKPVPLTRGDEGLIILSCIMLLAILLLLGYMYSNGRL